MKFYLPTLQIATLQPPQSRFLSKFGGLPWGLPLERWCSCQTCGKPMSLLAQLRHDPPALDLGRPDQVLHLFQCQECFGYEPQKGNDAILVPAQELGEGLTEPQPPLELLVGELWIAGWEQHDDGLDPALARDIFDQQTWMDLPDSIIHPMFESRWRTKAGGIPYWTGNGPQHKPRRGYTFLFQLDTSIEFRGEHPDPNEIGGLVVVTEPGGKQECRRPDPKDKKRNAPWDVGWSENGKFCVTITNLGTDGTAYVFINRRPNPPRVYWLWNR